MITQSFAQAAIDIVRNNHRNRQGAYNKEPIDYLIPGYTRTINGILKNEPSATPASDAEIADVLKAVMGTAIIHGSGEKIDLAHRHESSPSYKHFKILELTEMLSQHFSRMIKPTAFSDKDTVIGLILSLRKEHINQALALLGTYNAKITPDLFTDLFATVYHEHITGANKEGADSIRGFNGPDPLSDVLAASARSSGGSGGGGGSAVARSHAIPTNPFSVREKQYIVFGDQKEVLSNKWDGLCEIYAINIATKTEHEAMRYLLNTKFNTQKSLLSIEDALEAFKAVFLPEYKRYLAGQVPQPAVVSAPVAAREPEAVVVRPAQQPLAPPAQLSAPLSLHGKAAARPVPPQQIQMPLVRASAAAEDPREIEASYTTFDTWKRTAVGQNVSQIAQSSALTTSQAGIRAELDAKDSRQNFPYELTTQAFVNFFHYINQYVIPTMRVQNKKVHAYLDINHDSLAFENVRDNNVPTQQLQRAKQIADSGLIWVKPVQFNPGHWWTLSVQKELNGTYLIKIWNSSGSDHAREIDRKYEEQIKRLFSQANELTQAKVRAESKQLGVQIGTLSCGIWVLNVIQNLIEHGDYNPAFATDREKVMAEADLIDRLLAYTALALARQEVNEIALNNTIKQLRATRHAAGVVYDEWAYEPIQGEMNTDYLGRFYTTLQAQFKNDPAILAGNVMGALNVVISNITFDLEEESEKKYKNRRRNDAIMILRRNVLAGNAYREEDKATVERIPMYVKNALTKLLELIETSGLNQDYGTLPPTDKDQILFLLNKTIDIFSSRVVHTQKENIHMQLLDLVAAITGDNKARIVSMVNNRGFTDVMDEITQDKNLFPEVLNFTTFRNLVRRIDPTARAVIIGAGGGSAAAASYGGGGGSSSAAARADDWPYTYIMCNGDIEGKDDANVKDTETVALQRTYMGVIRDCKNKTTGMIIRFSGEQNIPTGAALTEFAIERAIQNVYRTPAATHIPALDAELEQWLRAKK